MKRDIRSIDDRTARERSQGMMVKGLVLALVGALALVAHPALLAQVGTLPAPAPLPDAAPTGDPVLDNCLLSLVDDVEVPAQEAGQIRLLEAREGNPVEADTVIGHIEDSKVKLEREVAYFEAEVAKEQAINDVNVRFAHASSMVAEWSLRVAEDANARAERAVPQALVIQRKFELRKAELSEEQAKRDMKVAELTAQAKTAALNVADDQIERRKIRAPVSGIVVELKRAAGEWVQAGEPVLRIARMDTLRVETSLNAAQFNHAEVMNRPVTVMVALAHGRSEEFQGKVTFARPEVEADGSYTVWAEIPNRRENAQWMLQPGLKATMTVHINPLASNDPPAPGLARGR